MSQFRDYLSGDAAVRDRLKEIENAGFIIAYLADELIIKTQQGIALRTCYNKMQIHAFAKEQSQDSRKPVEANEVLAGASPRVRIAELEMTVGRLRKREILALAQRDQWEQRALVAEQQLANRVRKASDQKYQKLKHALAKLFHPDHSPASGTEKITRAETFKLIWKKIEEIDRS
jgi:hypothetical protein